MERNKKVPITSQWFYRIQWKRQDEVSELTGIPQYRISRMLNKPETIRLWEFIAISQALDLDFDTYLLEIELPV